MAQEENKDIKNEEKEQKNVVKEEVKETKKEKKISKEDKLKEEIARLEKALKDEKDKNLREIAEMQTTKRRLKEAEINNRKYASMGVVEELIAPIDMLLSVVNSEAPSEEIKNYQIGFKMIATQLVSILEKEGLKPIPCKEGEEFNPSLMQALESVEDPNITQSKITKVLQKGYMFKDRVLKPVMVNVAIPQKVENKLAENTETKEKEND